MREATLIFPTVNDLSEFIFSHSSGSIEVNSQHRLLKGILPDQKIAIACSAYKAEFIPAVSFSDEEED